LEQISLQPQRITKNRNTKSFRWYRGFF